MAARDRLGGLADQTLAAMLVMRALFDRVLIETVGVGQSESDVAGVADTVVFCVQPGSGDALQFMKAGIVEIPHLVVVTKADLGAAAERARADVAGALSLARAGEGDWPLAWPCARHQGWRRSRASCASGGDGRLAVARHRQSEGWVRGRCASASAPGTCAAVGSWLDTALRRARSRSSVCATDRCPGDTR
jgi:LAO/AO transport system kinase